MAPTSDERREVAARLREASACGEGISCHAVDKALGLRYDDDYFGDVFTCESVRGFADFIDPTCEVVGTTSEEGLYGPTIFHHKLSCGHMCDTGWPEPPKYCDECGRRVIDGE